MSSYLPLILLILLICVYSEPWYSIPLKFTANNEHFVTTISFGSPNAFSLDIIMDTGSGKFHIYNHTKNNISSNNIKPYDTNSFQCICQTMIDNDADTAYLIESNHTWYQYSKTTTSINHTNRTIINESYKSFLPGCPLWNETHCNQWAEQCQWTDITTHRDDDDPYYCNDIDIDTDNDTHNTSCREKTCRPSNGGDIIVNGETVSFECRENCYSGIDIISFTDINIAAGTNRSSAHYVPYVYADAIALNNKEHNFSLFTNESWADGTLGLVYDYTQQTSFWQILGIKQAHSVLIAFDSLRQQLDIGHIPAIYADNSIDYSENIWWGTDYHYFYIYSLSVCNMDLFDTLQIGSQYLAMIDTGATCLTLPPQLFDLLFNYIPYGFKCDSNQTFCYIASDMDINDAYQFPMLSFAVNLNNNSKTFYISLKDLIIKLADDERESMRYCIERGKHSIYGIDECDAGAGNSDCTLNGIIIFGVKVLHSLYTILDYPHKRIGFANNKITNYTQEMYVRANANTCKIQTECTGEDVLNISYNRCESARDKCELYWTWTYDADTHYCVLQAWVYAIIPIVWIVILIVLLVFVRFKMWIDQHIYYTAIKV